MEDSTRRFTAIDERSEIRDILTSVYNSLKVKGYNPINQLVGYIVSEDPTYITNYNGARTLAGQINRTDLLADIVSYYLEEHQLMEPDIKYEEQTLPAGERCG